MYLPLTIGIGGSKSGVGKTNFIECFIKFVKNFNKSIPILAIKFTKNSFHSSIVTDFLILDQINKDTSRMKKAGADSVFWIKSTEEQLPNIVSKLKNDFLSRSKFNFGIVLIEGNSLIREMQPDVIIFIKGKNLGSIKPSAEFLLGTADIIIEDKYSMEEIMTEIETIQMKKIIGKLLQERSNGGKITCSEARKIAEEINVPYIEVGRVANELKIKIRKCELGCF